MPTIKFGVIGLVLGLTVLSLQPLFAQAKTAQTIRVRLENAITTESASAGDSVSARLIRPLSNGAGITAPTGSRFQGRVDSVHGKSVSDDGWMLLVFNRIELPDGKEVRTIATGSFHKSQPHTKRDHILAIGALGAIGVLLG